MAGLGRRSESYVMANPLPGQIAVEDSAANYSVESYDPLAALREFEERQHNGSSAFNSRKDKHMSLEFSNLQLDLVDKKGGVKKNILQGVTGRAMTGDLLAIMGSSGAGKSSLLNLLAGRLSNTGNLNVSGSVLVNGKPRDWDSFRLNSAYVLQDDLLYAEMTVRETIMLSARLRLPASMSLKEKEERVDSIIAELGLTHCQHTQVGSDLLRGVSGGERKRVNIGNELVTDPSLVFLDEPTSGLDSFNAQNVMTACLFLARNGRTVVATIHQPRSSIYQMFDKLLILSDRRPMYFGDAKLATDYFTKLGFPCPANFNPADFMLDLVSPDYRSEQLTSESMARIDSVADSFEANTNLPAITHEDSVMTKGGKKQGKYASSWMTQFTLLSSRALRIMAREKANNIAQVMQNLIFGILVGLIWLQEGRDPYGQHLQSIAGVIFFILINNSFTGIFGIIFIFPQERAIVLKERASRTYGVGAYFASKSVAELPRTASVVLLFTLVTYYMVGLRDGAEHYFTMYLVIMLTVLCAEGWAYTISAAAKDAQQANALAPVVIVASLLFGGFFIAVEQIPLGLRWLRYLSFLQYAFSALMINEFDDRDLCSGSCLDKCEPNSFCPETGREVLDAYNIDVDERGLAANIVILLAMATILRVFAYIVLRRRGPKYLKQ
eukprot:m.184618 g.184618  ORF g.184618 m.184618 type:complete len:667 (-) comp15561_c0_seq2:148-2148(-)